MGHPEDGIFSFAKWQMQKKNLSPPNHLLRVVSLRKAFLLPTNHTYPLDVLEPLLLHYLVWISLFSVLGKPCLCAFSYWLCVEWGFFVSFVFVIYSKILWQKKTKRSKYGKILKSRRWIHKGVFMIPFSQLFYIFESFNNKQFSKCFVAKKNVLGLPWWRSGWESAC